MFTPVGHTDVTLFVELYGNTALDLSTWCWQIVSVKGQTVSLWPRGPFTPSQLHGSPIGAEEQPDGV